MICLVGGGIGMFCIGGVVAFLAATDPAPRIVVTPSSVRLAVPNGQPVQTTFILRNEGDATLLVTDVESQCTCTVPQALQTRILAPGASEPLVVVYTAFRAGGSASEPIVIQANDPNHPVTAVTLLATSEPEPDDASAGKAPE
jgi:hypothetical protein